tara:strand:- start:522 stop:1076 length:555 start_codon:yes stop_codon:yes gene_type:complete
MNSYLSLSHQVFLNENFKLVPIRFEDRIDIMNWRNEQIYHLRQDKLLTIDDQDYYFENIINELFKEEKPNQLLFSFLQNDVCIGYGGLVNINWNDKNAEISFIMDTKLEKDYFNFHWSEFLKLIEEVAFKELNFHKIFTYAFDLRPQLYITLENSGFFQDARLKGQCLYSHKFIDVVIHSKINL